MRFAATGWMLLSAMLLVGCEDIGWDPYAGEGGAPPEGGQSKPPPEGVPSPGMSLKLEADGPGGFVNNPENIRGTLKCTFPSRYTGLITRVWAHNEDNSFYDPMRRGTPNETQNRERYYGNLPIEDYPDNLIVTATLSNGSSIYYVIPDPQVRYD